MGKTRRGTRGGGRKINKLRQQLQQQFEEDLVRFGSDDIESSSSPSNSCSGSNSPNSSKTVESVKSSNVNSSTAAQGPPEVLSRPTDASQDPRWTSGGWAAKNWKSVLLEVDTGDVWSSASSSARSSRASSLASVGFTGNHASGFSNFSNFSISNFPNSNFSRNYPTPRLSALSHASSVSSSSSLPSSPCVSFSSPFQLPAPAASSPLSRGEPVRVHASGVTSCLQMVDVASLSELQSYLVSSSLSNLPEAFAMSDRRLSNLHPLAASLQLARLDQGLTDTNAHALLAAAASAVSAAPSSAARLSARTGSVTASFVAGNSASVALSAASTSFGHIWDFHHHHHHHHHHHQQQQQQHYSQECRHFLHHLNHDTTPFSGLAISLSSSPLSSSPTSTWTPSTPSSLNPSPNRPRCDVVSLRDPVLTAVALLRATPTLANMSPQAAGLPGRIAQAAEVIKRRCARTGVEHEVIPLPISVVVDIDNEDGPTDKRVKTLREGPQAGQVNFRNDDINNKVEQQCQEQQCRRQKQKQEFRQDSGDDGDVRGLMNRATLLLFVHGPRGAAPAPPVALGFLESRAGGLLLSELIEAALHDIVEAVAAWQQVAWGQSGLSIPMNIGVSEETCSEAQHQGKQCQNENRGQHANHQEDERHSNEFFKKQQRCGTEQKEIEVLRVVPVLVSITGSEKLIGTLADILPGTCRACASPTSTVSSTNPWDFLRRQISKSSPTSRSDSSNGVLKNVPNSLASQSIDWMANDVLELLPVNNCFYTLACGLVKTFLDSLTEETSPDATHFPQGRGSGNLDKVELPTAVKPFQYFLTQLGLPAEVAQISSETYPRNLRDLMQGVVLYYLRNSTPANTPTNSSLYKNNPDFSADNSLGLIVSAIASMLVLDFETSRSYHTKASLAYVRELVHNIEQMCTEALHGLCNSSHRISPQHIHAILHIADYLANYGSIKMLDPCCRQVTADRIERLMQTLPDENESSNVSGSRSLALLHRVIENEAFAHASYQRPFIATRSYAVCNPSAVEPLATFFYSIDEHQDMGNDQYLLNLADTIQAIDRQAESILKAITQTQERGFWRDDAILQPPKDLSPPSSRIDARNVLLSYWSRTATAPRLPLASLKFRLWSSASVRGESFTTYKTSTFWESAKRLPALWMTYDLKIILPIALVEYVNHTDLSQAFAVLGIALSSGNTQLQNLSAVDRGSSPTLTGFTIVNPAQSHESHFVMHGVSSLCHCQTYRLTPDVSHDLRLAVWPNGVHAPLSWNRSPFTLQSG